MKSFNGSTRLRRKRTSASQRARLLQAFDRSGLSAAAFARRHALHYTTFCNWRRRQSHSKPSPGFVQVELPVSTELVIELGAPARLRLTSLSQMDLAVCLLQRLQAAC
jgi:transposase-like protein